MISGPLAAVLFDIDGTLLHSHGAGRKAFVRAVTAWLGRTVETEQLDFSGRTDLDIFRRLVGLAGEVYPTPEVVQKVSDLYLRNLAEELSAGPRAQAYPGVPGLLAALADDRSWAVGLLTGNLAAGASLKLRAAGLEDFFSFGAYGDDAEDRNLLVPVALRRLEERFGVVLPSRAVVVVGDTCRDVDCARAGGARVLAVGTGFEDPVTLRESQPDEFVPDLSDTVSILRMLSVLTDLHVSR